MVKIVIDAFRDSESINDLREPLLNPWGANGNFEIGTPQPVFDALDKEFHFTLDVCASAENTKCAQYCSGPCKLPELCNCGLCSEWGDNICWMNPPYSNGVIGQWIDKAISAVISGATVVCLTHLAVSPKWARKMSESGILHELRGVYPRIQFLDQGSSNARDSMISVLNWYSKEPKFSFWTWK